MTRENRIKIHSSSTSPAPKIDCFAVRRRDNNCPRRRRVAKINARRNPKRITSDPARRSNLAKRRDQTRRRYP